MIKKITFLLLVLNFSITSAQNSEQSPVFPNCKNKNSKELETCFYNEIQNYVFTNFKVPEIVKSSNYMGSIMVLFEVDEKGLFKVLYIDSDKEELVKESKRIFESLPKINPGTYNGKPTYTKYSIKIAIPLVNPALQVENRTQESTVYDIKNPEKELKEFENIALQKFNNPQFKSHLNIQFSHSYYAQFDPALNQVGSNNHTAVKPYTYSEVSKYYNLEAENSKLQLSKSSWWGRKIWNENTAAIQGDGYWFTLNPIFDMQVGKSEQKTYINTRGIQVRGAIGEQLHFSSTIFESQGKFANYYNDYIYSIRPSGGNPGIVPGMGIAKDFKTDAYDFPMAEANITYTPSKFINLQLGYGRNFIGDGYRSLFLTDGVSPYPYFKINTNFWKIKYTNVYMWLKDVRPDVTVDGTYASKYAATHYLSWNLSKRFNLGLFESVVWANQNNRGFDMSFVNPIIFYRAVEISASSKSGNALLGFSGKYKLSNNINVYGQFLIDEFSFHEVKAGNNSWKNKFAQQIGVKFYNAFHVNNLLLQFEYNRIRPYVYSHSDIITNYGSYNQSLGHQWGGNAKEMIAIARYHKGRYFVDAKVTYGIRGLDYDGLNYGGNIYLNYNENRPYDVGVEIGQGDKTKIIIADLQAGYLVNPATNLKVFGSFIYRSFQPSFETDTITKSTTTWISLGLRCDIFNWYFDY
ncbi:gliding motility protein RemB [Flavobacterium aciduliphilum]|uniref:Protein involved in gliding motility RemB n=1 Tax=Flavobacterium aciduliphilum TaxID=1101402 RepID=A0A328YF39_9FLAO|nr:gliding motility protein RemB [Flavobacterium aciduliphilum]RAR71773.1 protein involved in gliding motility RemB [Flavobacterium aciduliphilum]